MTELFTPVGWQRRIKNPTVPPGDARRNWTRWTECSDEQGKYASEHGSVEGFPELVAEARQVGIMPEDYTTTQPRIADQEMVEFLHGCTGCVEANRNEQHNIWAEHVHYADKIGYRKFTWEQNPMGYSEHIGNLTGRPVYLSLTTAIVEGQKILFYDVTSTVADHDMVRAWLDFNMPKTAFREDGWLNNTDATNFSNVLRR